MNKISKICKTCWKEFIKKTNCSKKSWEKYVNCSLECKQKSLPEQHIRKCPICEKIFKVRNYRWETAKYCSQKCSAEWKINHINPVNYVIRKRQIYINWRKYILERDNYTCKICWIKSRKWLWKTVTLNVDHIKSLRQIVINNNLFTIEDMINCE